MRRTKQIILTILITLVLLALVWSAQASGSPPKTINVVAAKRDVPAGTLLTADQLMIVQLPEALNSNAYLTDIAEAAGQWTSAPFSGGELLSRQRLTLSAAGIVYPDAGPGRRLLTIDLEPSDAVGFWLAAGSLVDLYLIPRNRESGAEIQILEKVRVMAIISPVTSSPIAGTQVSDGNADGLICLDLNHEQARIIISSRGLYDITLSAINENLPQLPTEASYAVPFTS
jgi:pilus assembly protein CpaB